MTVLDAPRIGAGYRAPVTPATSSPYTARIRQKAASLPRPRSSVARRLLRGVSLLLALIALASLAAIGSLQVLQSSRTATTGYELQQLQQQRSERSAEVRLLEAEIAQMTNLGTVHAAATGRLGMVRPTESVRISVSVPTPDVAPMPERYVRRTPAPVAELEPWWAEMLWGVYGLDQAR